MSTVHEIRVPDLGSVAEADVIAVAVAVGDVVAEEGTLITLETDKASMDVPAPMAGRVQQVLVRPGDKVKTGTLIAVLETNQTSANIQGSAAPEPISKAPEVTPAPQPASSSADASSASLEIISFPDLGTEGSVAVIALLHSVGASVQAGVDMVTLESDKASMDVPTTASGVIVEWLVSVGSQVKTGMPFVKIQTTGTASGRAPTAISTPQPTAQAFVQQPQPEMVKSAPAMVMPSAPMPNVNLAHAGPATRRLARELGVDLGRVTGTGHRQRITTDDVKLYVKTMMQSGATSGTGIAVAPMPVIDFNAYGPTQVQTLGKIKKLTARNLHRNWVNIPHVTHNEEADITEMESFRQEQKEAMAAQGIRLTPLVFMLKAVVSALKTFPQFNASLSPDGESLILKNYYHIGVAVDTPSGLVVPVIRDVDKKGLLDLAKELAFISDKAKKTGLSLSDMQGGCFTISSLGGIGGTSFTPIINAPEVAILGVSKAKMQPIYKEGLWTPRLMLPLSLSYDHRVIDGAEAARFSLHLAQQLSDIRCLLL